MARLYTVVLASATLPATNAFDVVELTPADDRPIRLVGISLDNVGIAADAGDAQEELLPITIVRGHTTSGSGGSSYTANPVNTLDSAAGFAAEIANTTIASTAGTIVAGLGWNTRVPLREYFPEELQLWCSQASTTLVVRITTAGADAVTFSGTIWVAEV